jgi:hypothetical protein
MSVLSKSILRFHFFLGQPRIREVIETRGKSPSALKELFVADWGVDLEHPSDGSLAEKAIPGGNCVGASTLAGRGYLRWPGLWGALVDGNWWILRKYAFT